MYSCGVSEWFQRLIDHNAVCATIDVSDCIAFAIATADDLYPPGGVGVTICLFYATNHECHEFTQMSSVE
jgi:hypothetical protein